jgi:hypothetical protein
MIMDRQNFLGTMLFMVGGLVIWGAHFTFLYAFNTLACARSFADAEVFGFGAVPFAVGLATLIAFVGAGAVLVSALASDASGRPAPGAANTDRFLNYAAAAIAIISLVAILWNGFPAALVPPCG